MDDEEGGEEDAGEDLEDMSESEDEHLEPEMLEDEQLTGPAYV